MKADYVIAGCEVAIGSKKRLETLSCKKAVVVFTPIGWTLDGSHFEPTGGKDGVAVAIKGDDGWWRPAVVKLNSIRMPWGNYELFCENKIHTQRLFEAKRKEQMDLLYQAQMILKETGIESEIYTINGHSPQLCLMSYSAITLAKLLRKTREQGG